jgi:serine/threonine protein kinase
VEHLDDNAASEFVSGSLAPAAFGEVERHLAGCRDCRALVAALAADSGDDSNATTFRDEPASVVTTLPHRTPAIGDRVGRYLVLSSLGAGGMGVVFAAYDPNLGRKIALKLLRSGVAGSSKDGRSRLQREAQAIAQLSHPNVVSVYDVGTTDDGDLYIAMEFVEGDTLTSWLRKYPRAQHEIIDVFVQAARGLASAHGVGLLHRDFKPDNVLVGFDGRVRVTDFGLARSVLAPEETQVRPVMTALNLALTATGTVLGTPRYMPPEQMTGADLDARSDQFSFCVALYEALYGLHPLRSGTSAVMVEHGDQALPPPEATKVPAAIGRAVLRGLERERARRFPSMSALIDELVPPPRRAPVRYAGLAIVAVIAVGGVAAVVAQQPGPGPSQPAADRGGAEIDPVQHRAVLEDNARLRSHNQQLRDENAQLREDVQRRDADIQLLTAERVEMPSRVRPGDRPSVRAEAMPGRAAADALAAVQAPIAGCFRAWEDRTPLAREDRPSATLVIGLTVTPDGRGTLPKILSTPDYHRAAPGGAVSGKTALERCVSEQIARAKFPATASPSEIVASILWSAGRVTLYPMVVGHRMARGGSIELR